MKNLKIYLLALTTAISLTTPSIVMAKEKNQTEKKNKKETIEDLNEIQFENPDISYGEIEYLLKDSSWQTDRNNTHRKNSIYQKETNTISWENVFLKIKENNTIYLKEHPELSYLTTFSDTELKEILNTHKDFINLMNSQYDINLENVACNLSEQEILKDTRIPVLEVPYFANYEASTQTMIFLEDSDSDYYEITKAHEESHLLQGSCIDTSKTKTKQSVWEEPIEYAQKTIPSPLRTICLDEYIAYIQSQKINPEYQIDTPNFDFLYLLELSFLPNKNYKFQETLTTLSFNQNQKDFYKLFKGKGKEIEAHKIMHTIDLYHGYFKEEIENFQDEDQKLLRTAILKINCNLFKNILEKKEKYDKEDLFYLIALNKKYSLYILENEMIEQEIQNKEEIRFKYLKDYEQIENQFFQQLQLKYHDSKLKKQYENYDFKKKELKTNKENQELLTILENNIEYFQQENSQIQKEKSLSKK